MQRRVVASLLLLIAGCGDTALDRYQDASDNTFSPPEYIIFMPSNPPFIEFNDSNTGELDDFTYDEDVELPSTPIPQPPDIF